MSVPGGGNGPELNYGINFDTSGLQSASRQIEAWSQQLGDRLKRDLSAEARIDIKTAEQAFQRLQALSERYAQQTQQALIGSTRGLDSAYQASGQVAQRVAQQTQQSWVLAANNSAKAWTESHNRAFSEIEKRAQRTQELANRARTSGGIIGRGGGGPISSGEPEQPDEPALHAFAAGALRGLTRGFGGGAGVPIGIGLTATAAGAIVVANAVETMTRSITGAVESGFKFNSSLEQSQLIFKQLTGDVTVASAAIADLRKYADITPFNTDEVIKSGQAFLRVTQGDTQAMLELVKAAGALATTNPEQGLAGATYAIRELLGGDVQSIADRFNISRRAIRAMMDEGLSGIQLIQRINQELGVSSKTVEELSKTFEGRLSNVTSFAQNIGQAFTFPSFQGVSEDLGAVSDNVTKNQQAWMELAGAIGLVVDKAGDFAKSAITSLPNVAPIVAVGGFVKSFVESRQAQLDAERSPAAKQNVTEQQQVKEEIKSVNVEIAKQGGLIDSTKAKISANTAELSKLKAQAAEITREYERQIIPLQRQQELLNRPNIAREKQLAGFDVQGAQLDIAKLNAQPPVQQAAAAASRNVQLDAALRLAQIEARRIEIAQDYVDSQTRGKSALDAQADALEKNVKATQREVQAANEVRQARIQGLREEQQLAQQVRSERIDGLREEARTAQQTRNDNLDVLRDQIRSSQELRSESRQTAKDLQDVYDDAYTAIEHASDRAHRKQSQNFDDQIDKIRRAQDAFERASKEPSAAEKQLESLNKAEREHDRQQQLLEARRAVAQARTGTARGEAQQRLQETIHSQGVDTKREQLQEKIKAEEKADEQKKLEFEDKIQAVQDKARKADRQYQQDKEQKDIARENELSQRRVQERAQEVADRAAKRAEDEQTRQAEKADKLATRQEQDQIREQEKADKLVERQEKAEIAAQEKADKEADRQERQKTTALQIEAENAREAATAEREAREEARQKSADARKATVNAIELERLNIEEGLIKAQDTNALAAEAASRVVLERSILRVKAEGQIEDGLKRQLSLDLQGKIDAAKDAEYNRLIFIQDQTKQYETQGTILTSQLDVQKARLDAMKEDLKDLENRAARLQKEKFEGAPGQAPSSITNAPSIRTQGLGGDLAEGVIAGASGTFGNDQSVAQDIIKWVDGWIVGAKNTLGIKSPSTVFAQLAQDCIDGFVNRIIELVNAPVDAFNTMFNSMTEQAGLGIEGYNTTIVDGLNALPGRIAETAQGTIDAVWAPFQSLIDTYLPTLDATFLTSGTNAVTNWINGWYQNSPVKAVSDTFNDLTSNFFSQLNSVFNQAGQNSGISWINGWVEAWNDNWSNVQNSISNSISNVQRTVSNATGGRVGLGADTSQFQPQQQQAYGDTLTSEERARIVSQIDARYGSRATGGPLLPGHMYKIHEGEYVDIFTKGGQVHTPNDIREMFNQAGGGSRQSVVNIQPNAINMAVSAGSQQDLKQFSDEFMKVLVQAIDSAQRYAPNPAKDTLGGAS